MTIFSVVHEGDSIHMFFWNAWGLALPEIEGLVDTPSYRQRVTGVGPGGTSTALIADVSRGGSRIHTNPGDLVDRAAALDALKPSYPLTVGARGAVYSDTRQTRRWILSVQIGSNPDHTLPADQADAAGAYCLARWNTGLWSAIILATLPSRTDGILANFDTTYAQPYNAIIKGAGWAAAHGVTAIADIASDSRLGATNASANATYFSDTIHPTAAGAAVGGPILRTVFDSVMAGL